MKLSNLLFLFISFSLFSQIKILKSLTVEDGLSLSQVSQVVEDSKGYIWFTTFDGASRWDGKSFENYGSDHQFSSTILYDMIEVDNKFYFATRSGLTIWDSGKTSFQKVGSSIKSNYITKLLSLDSLIYIASNEGLYVLKNQSIEKISSLEDRQINALTLLNKALYIATNSGLFKYEDNNLQQIENTNGIGITVVKAIDRTIFFYKRNTGLFKVDGIKSVAINTLIKDNAWAIESHNNVLYIGTSSGLYLLNSGKIIDYLSIENGLSNNYIIALTFDRYGTLYIGTNGGGVNLYRYNEIHSWNTFSLSKSSTINQIHLINNHIQIVLKDQLLQFTNNAFIKSPLVEFIKTSQLVGFDHIANHHLYVTSQGGYFLDSEHFATKNNDFLLDGKFIDKNNILLATLNGVLHINNGIEKRFNTFSENVVYSIEKSKYRIVAITKYGLYAFEKDMFIEIPLMFDLKNKFIRTFLEIDEHTFLIGTSNGLYLQDNIQSKEIDQSYGLIDDFITQVIYYKDSTYFVSTKKGISELVYHKKDKSFLIKNITSHQGLVGDETNSRSLVKDSENSVWIGTMKGLSRFFPENVSQPLIPPKLHIEHITASDSILDINLLDYKLSHTINTISIKANILYQYAPDEVNFLYRFSNNDKWKVSPIGEFIFPNLAYGEYTFEIKGKTYSSLESEIIRIHWTIDKPYWLTIWFMSIVSFLLLCLLSYSVYVRFQYRINREKMRIKLAANLHDDIGSGLTEISILSRLVKQSKDIKLIDTILEKSENLIQDMGNIVWLINPKYDQISDLFRKLSQLFSEVMKEKEIRFVVEDNLSLRKDLLSIELKEAIFYILKEAITNAIKHSECKQLTLTANVDHQKLIILFTDDGIGFNTNAQFDSNGLLNMVMRAEKFGLKLYIDSKLNNGTRISLSGIKL